MLLPDSQPLCHLARATGRHQGYACSVRYQKRLLYLCWCCFDSFSCRCWNATRLVKAAKPVFKGAHTMCCCFTRKKDRKHDLACLPADADYTSVGCSALTLAVGCTAKPAM
ncbi:hypothetical protein ABPG77_007119 [Micractinium sp. CCAP 211/92]